MGVFSLMIDDRIPEAIQLEVHSYGIKKIDEDDESTMEGIGLADAIAYEIRKVLSKYNIDCPSEGKGMVIDPDYRGPKIG